ncbi:MAG: ABC transporter ATP-binding protein [Candidatus Dojkabacteria bacterium]|nr:ABC transporter ATP-binding protein [Candidatus Dojkabacteria bacterium]
MIKLTNIYKSYKDGKNSIQVLKNINYTFEKGKSYGIVGKSGSGKSTLMHIMAGLDTPTEGKIFYNNQNIGLYPENKRAQLRNHKIGFIFQQFFLLPNKTVKENIELPLIIRGESYKEIDKKSRKIIKEVNLTEQMDQKAINLSGGQKQRVAIARALITEPEIIFADEPTGNLDSENGEKIINLLFELHRKHKTILIIVTHDFDIANKCDVILKIKNGIIERS